MHVCKGLPDGDSWLDDRGCLTRGLCCGLNEAPRQQRWPDRIHDWDATNQKSNAIQGFLVLVATDADVRRSVGGGSLGCFALWRRLTLLQESPSNDPRFRTLKLHLCFVVRPLPRWLLHLIRRVCFIYACVPMLPNRTAHLLCLGKDHA
jgi:hypothetical protein